MSSIFARFDYTGRRSLRICERELQLCKRLVIVAVMFRISTFCWIWTLQRLINHDFYRTTSYDRRSIAFHVVVVIVVLLAVGGGGGATGGGSSTV